MVSLIPNVGPEFHFVHSCDLECHVQVKICTLDGTLARLNYEDLLENPLLKFSGRSQSKYPDLMVETVVKSKDNGLHLPVLTSFKSFTNRWEWNEWVKLPIKYSDLPRNADLHLTVYDCSGANVRTDVGSISVSLFGKHGVFKEGQLDLRLSSKPQNTSSCLSTSNTSNIERLAKLTKDYHAGKIPQIDWLDRLTFAEIEKANQKEKIGSNQLFLMIQFPIVQYENKIHSVVYFEKNMNSLNESTESSTLVKFQDPEVQMENLVEAKHYKLTRSQRAGHSEKDLKPNATARNRLNEIISYPSTQTLTNEEKDQIWQYRLYLSANKKALAKFVKVVNWNTPSEAVSALAMVHKWAPMDPEDALELLGPSFTYPGVRQYAVCRLQQAPDEDLQLYLLQLVQALKYENIDAWASDDKTVSEETDPKSLEASYNRNSQSLEQSQSQKGASSTGDEAPDVSLATVGQDCAANIETNSLNPSGGLASFLIERASKNSVLSNYFYWYLMTECETHDAVSQRDEKAQETFEVVLKRFKSLLKNGPPEFRERAEFLERQYQFVDKLVLLVKAVAKESGTRTKKIERLQALLSDSDSFKYNFENFGPLQLPLDPSIRVCGIVASDASLFKSSLMPARITFVNADQPDQPYVTIFKHGDDLRQDQLILQIITLMDRILQQENLDLKLTPYRVLATSSKHGFVQFVDSLAIAEVLRSEGCIQNFFRKHNPSESSPYGISADVMDTYVKSCAGYCVITYLLGVGDRHLDNLLLTKSGKLFHIDFGYILGRDPKPMPPPMKLSKEMIEAFGGVNSEHYNQFRKECYTAFLSLRRYANLILNLFSLMVDASVPDIALEPDKTVRKVQEKFRLEMNDEEAVRYMQSLIDVSATAVMAALVERLHKFAQFLRN